LFCCSPCCFQWPLQHEALGCHAVVVAASHSPHPIAPPSQLNYFLYDSCEFHFSITSSQQLDSGAGSLSHLTRGQSVCNRVQPPTSPHLNLQPECPNTDPTNSERRMELLYAQNYSQTSTRKTCACGVLASASSTACLRLLNTPAGGIGVAVLDVRKPLKSAEDSVTKVVADFLAQMPHNRSSLKNCVSFSFVHCRRRNALLAGGQVVQHWLTLVFWTTGKR